MIDYRATADAAITQLLGLSLHTLRDRSVGLVLFYTRYCVEMVNRMSQQDN
jgi:hypothetical protein